LLLFCFRIFASRFVCSWCCRFFLHRADSLAVGLRKPEHVRKETVELC
jgi:hypothetical protein